MNSPFPGSCRSWMAFAAVLLGASGALLVLLPPGAREEHGFKVGDDLDAQYKDFIKNLPMTHTQVDPWPRDGSGAPASSMSPGGTAMAAERIIFRGMRVTPDWPERLREAQLQTTCRPNGVEMPRVSYGDEEDDWGANDGPCHDCAAIKGELHVPGCDVERCPACGGQLWFGCECERPEDDHDGGT